MTDQENFDRYIKPLIWTGSPVAELLKVPDPVDIPNIQEIYSRQFAVEAANKEDQLLVEVLQEHLGRLVCVEDFKDCQMKFPVGRPNEYTFAYRCEDLGVVRRETKLEFKIDDPSRNTYSIQHVIEFYPVKKLLT